jgi:pimeloyl-ACP methyl ester carboxylesterase
MANPNSDFEIAGNGNPTLIVIGSPSAWQPIWSKLVTITKIVRYDTGDLVNRQSIQTPYSAQIIVKDLLELVEENKISLPFVVIGFSVSGLFAQLLSREHPRLISGLILIDSMHPDQRNRFAKYSQEAATHLREEIASVLPHLDFDKIENELQNASAFQQEIPLLVISRGIEADLNVATIWKELQTELSEMSDISHHIVAKESRHAIHFYEPELVIREIRQFINEIRLTPTPT